ncbi:flagellar hook-length control protein FliK [Noviherbaspirillum agri]
MQTSQVSNPANMFTAPSPANKQPDANSAAQPFNQVLSREMDGRRNTNAAEANKTKEASPPSSYASKQPVKNNTTKQAESKPAAESKTKEEAAAAEDVPADAAQASEDMLALVANVSQLTAPVEEAASTDALVAETPVATDPALLMAGAQSDKNAGQLAAQLDALAQTEKAGAQGKQDVALSAAIDRSAAQQETTVPDTELATSLAALGADAKDAKLTQAPTDFSAAVQNSMSAMAASTAPVQNAAMQAANAVDRLTPRVGTPGWDQALGQKVVWMVAGEQQSASLTLNPPDLGPLQVVLNVSNSQANATFIAAQPEVRQALEAALPKLREMLGDAGIQLGQANVNSGEPNQQNMFDQQAAQRSGLGGGRRDGIDAPSTTASVHGGRVQTGSSGVGLVDTFV